jgi:tetratricopeptide (TPR) repeat protein
LVINGNYARAITVLTRAVQLAPRSHQAFTLRGYARLESKQYKEALDDFDEAIRLNASFTDAYRCRAFVRSMLGDKAGADEDQNKVSELLRPVTTAP